MALSNTFTPTAYTSMIVGPASSNKALPAATGSALITNLGIAPIVVLLGTANTVAVTVSTGVAIPAGQSLALVIGSNTYLAAITAGGGQTSLLNIAVGS